MTLTNCVALSLILCAIGIFGMLTRRNLLGILLSVEIILNGANINFAAFAHFRAADPVAGAVFPIFVMAVSACEIAVALAIIISMYRRKKRLDVYRMEELHG
ncbi:MAG: NADH dehydrogenase subunit K [Candidatus Electronema aureum]|jgi:NADH:ubiquinone oxidoreductase subunit K|uniref:NADH-quinone oxidoreductase subunit K n=1 Tax=Candidatus Electronema aureum TaxID=2005002 RepID=A0A521G4B5_9BACT|nr:MAG: NADH dehydrogenase subunit K [Candidatus Electronema aureum]